MKPKFGLLPLANSTCYLLAILAVAAAFPHTAFSQAPPVPSSFQALYTEMDNYLINFNATMPPPSANPLPTLMTGSLIVANSNAGPDMVNGMTGTTIPSYNPAVLQLNELKAMGVKAVMVEIGFPMLYAPYITGQGYSQTAFVNYYAAIANLVRAAGMKLIIENDTLLGNGNVQAGWDTSSFYPSLSWTQYMAARAQTAATIAQTMQPDYMVVLEEPDTEAMNTGQTNVNTSTGALQLLSTILPSVQAAGVPNLQVGAGVGSWLTNYQDFITAFLSQPINFVDFHIYPVNDNFLPNALSIISMANQAGLPVSMTECWLNKELDTEVNNLSSNVVSARNPFSFWQPLDTYFIQTMQTLSQTTQMLFLDPFNAEYYFAYLDYGPSTETLSPDVIMAQENATAQANNQIAVYTPTGMSYYASLVPQDTTAPSVPTGLTGVSGNPNADAISWNAATDDIGVAGYYVWRGLQNNPLSLVATTTQLTFDDSNLAEATTYTYAIQAFDLAGNVSALSAPINVQTSNATPPTVPGNVAGTAAACTYVKLTWTASTDKIGISKYNIFMGFSPTSLTQVATTTGTATSYGNNTLNAGTTYYFGVQAADHDGNISGMSNIAMVATPILPIPPATISAAASSTTKITVNWTAPSNPGGMSIARYYVWKGTSPTTLANVFTVTSPTYNDTSETASTTVYYAVQSVDSGAPASVSGLSSVVSATTYGPPSVPTNLAGAPTSATKISLSWSASVSGGSPIANYRVWKGTNPSQLSQVGTTTGLTYTDTNDTAATTYYYAVQSVDKATPPDTSALCTAIAVTTDSLPPAPVNLAATPVSASKITLTWTEPTGGNNLAVARYYVYGGTTLSKLSQLGITTATTYNNTSLQPLTTYYYYVVAADTANEYSPNSNTVIGITLALPSPPSNVQAIPSSSSQVAVSWLPSTGPLTINHYNVFRGTSPSALSQVATSTKTSYTDKSLNAGTTYYYSIQASDTGPDLSPQSPPVAATTQQ